MQASGRDLRRLWIAALGVFLLAGSTGALNRFWLAYGFPAGLQFVNVRHAHSHLMYFGWVTPALMALIATRLPPLIGRTPSPWIRRTIGATLGLALLAYPPFLLFGYSVAEIGGRRLPLSVITASLNILAWYTFIALYLRTTWGVPRSRPFRLWDAALAFQVLASMGAWGRGVLVGLKVTDPFLTDAAVYLFLDLFSDGWFMLALLGLAAAEYPVLSSSSGRWAMRLVIFGLPVTFLLGVPVSLVPTAVRLVAGLGGILVALGLLGGIWVLWPAVSRRPGTTWRVPLVFLGIKALAEFGIAVPSVALWAEQVGLRISYLHWLLLGFVTLGVLAAAKDAWGPATVRGSGWMTAGVILLIATLLPLTAL
ncbi:MAG TPA: hypothetical protein DEP84_09560 [Chloroflexi bacterium]|nr:hypothetical protein [Chloroflexota bacterium]